MGKGQRSRVARAEEMAEKKINAKKQAKRAKLIRIISIVCAIVLAAGMVSWITVASVQSAAKKNGTYLNRDIAATSASYKVSDAMMMYFFQNYYASFVSSNQSYLQMYGLDTNKSLKEQSCPQADADGNQQTWYDFFMSATKEQVKQILVLAEAAKNAGVTLEKEAADEIDKNVETLDTAKIAPGLGKDDVRTCMEIAHLASDYQTQINDSIKPTDADIEKYYKDNKDDFDVCTYRVYSFGFKPEGSTEETAATLTKEQAKKYADELAATKTEAAYLEWLKKYFTDVLKVDAGTLESELENTKTTDASYSAGTVGSDFIFGADTKAGDMKVVYDEEGNAYKTYLLLTPRHRNEETTRTVRHILFKVEDAEDKEADAAAKKKADAALAEYTKKGATEAAFAEIAKAQSEDGTAADGGLFADFTKSSVVTEFGNWSFDAARKAGDTAIVKTEYGYHVMYFVGVGAAEWKIDATSAYKTAEYQKKFDELAEKNKVTLDDKNIAKLADYVA